VPLNEIGKGRLDVRVTVVASLRKHVLMLDDFKVVNDNSLGAAHEPDRLQGAVSDINAPCRIHRGHVSLLEFAAVPLFWRWATIRASSGLRVILSPASRNKRLRALQAAESKGCNCRHGAASYGVTHCGRRFNAFRPPRRIHNYDAGNSCWFDPGRPNLDE
jgi:hypothetical protein